MISGVIFAGSKSVCINVCASGESVSLIISIISFVIRRVICISCASVSERASVFVSKYLFIIICFGL